MKKNTIRRLRTEDITAIINYLKDDRFDCCEFNDFWTESELNNWFSNKADICLGCFVGEELAGFCLSHFFSNANKVYLENIFVNSKYRRSGIASKLVQKLIDTYCKKNNTLLLRFVALVETTNCPAIATLKKEGFNVGDQMLWVQKNSTAEKV